MTRRRRPRCPTIWRQRWRPIRSAEAFFATLTKTNRFAILYRTQDAKKPETRAARIAKFVDMCHRHETIHPQS